MNNVRKIKEIRSNNGKNSDDSVDIEAKLWNEIKVFNYYPLRHRVHGIYCVHLAQNLAACGRSLHFGKESNGELKDISEIDVDAREVD